MIVDGILVGIGLAVGVVLIAGPLALLVTATRAAGRTRLGWRLRARIAIRRARPTTRER